MSGKAHQSIRKGFLRVINSPESTPQQVLRASECLAAMDRAYPGLHGRIVSNGANRPFRRRYDPPPTPAPPVKPEDIPDWDKEEEHHE